MMAFFLPRPSFLGLGLVWLFHLFLLTRSAGKKSLLQRGSRGSGGVVPNKASQGRKYILDLQNPSDLDYFKRCADGKHPVLLRNVFSHIDNDDWTERLITMACSSPYEIEYDVRESSSGRIESYACQFDEFIASLGGNSDHEDSMYLMNEDILNASPFEETLLAPLALPVSYFGRDLFQYFPQSIRPKLALIIGGKGSRSFLHGDPYEWTGWNYLFEGEKLCKPALCYFHCHAL